MLGSGVALLTWCWVPAGDLGPLAATRPPAVHLVRSPDLNARQASEQMMRDLALGFGRRWSGPSCGMTAWAALCKAGLPTLRNNGAKVHRRRGLQRQLADELTVRSTVVPICSLSHPHPHDDWPEVREREPANERAAPWG